MLIRPIDTLPTRASTPARMVLAVISALFLILAAGSMLAPAQAAQGGNSANAKLCQKGGYQKLYTSTGGTFTSNDECTSYAARGGTLSSSRYPAGLAQCTSHGGTFTESPAGVFGYRCDIAHNIAVSFDDVIRVCNALGGNSETLYVDRNLGSGYYTCSIYDPTSTS